MVTNNSTAQNLDIINSTPLVDYIDNVIWVTSRSACGTAQPSLWQINPTTGATEAIANLGDIDASPTLTFSSDVLFVGTVGDSIVGTTCTAGNSTIYAINPTTAATIASYASTDGPIVSYPVCLSAAPPYVVIFSGTTAVHLLTIDTSRTTPVFAQVWSTTIANPSAPISYTGSSYVYVGSSDGTIHELLLTTGADIKNGLPTLERPRAPSVIPQSMRCYHASMSRPPISALTLLLSHFKMRKVCFS